MCPREQMKGFTFSRGKQNEPYGNAMGSFSFPVVGGCYFPFPSAGKGGSSSSGPFAPLVLKLKSTAQSSRATQITCPPTNLMVFVLHPGITPLGNDPEWFKITRFYPEMRLNGVNTQWVYSQGVIQNFRTKHASAKAPLRGKLSSNSLLSFMLWDKVMLRKGTLASPRQHAFPPTHGCCWEPLLLMVV